MSARSTYVRWRLLPCTLLAVLIWSSPTFSQMVIDEYEPLRHDRFVRDRGNVEFIGDTLEIDFSGVGRVNEGPGRWVTMISPTHFLTSNHATADEGTVSFFNGNDLDSPRIECAINPDSGRRIGDTDVWLGSLESSAACDTSSLTYYDIASPANYAGHQVVSAGQSNQTLSARTTNFRVGRNVVSYTETGSFFRGDGDHLVYVDDSVAGDVRNSPPQPGAAQLDSEHRLANGDSGAPTFVRSVTGEYELLGLHSYLGYDGQPGETGFDADRWASVDAYLPTERNAIYDEVKLDDPSFTFVRNLDAAPVGDALGKDFFVLESGFDCSLDGRIGPDDLNCTTWVGALADLSQLLDEFNAPLGDIDLDGIVGFNEFLKLTTNFGKSGQYTDGDFTLDGSVDFSDFLVLTRNFGLRPDPVAAAAIPEPAASLGALWWFLVLLAIRPLRRISR